jgi:hypothetical protein
VKRPFDTILLKTLFFAVLGVLLLWFVVIDGRTNLPYFGIHLAIVALSVVHLVRARTFNLGLSFSFFALFFFGVIPLLEYKLGVTYNDARIPSDASYITAAGLALLSSVSFYTGYGLIRPGPPVHCPLPEPRYANRRHRHFVRAAILAGCLTLVWFISSYYGYEFSNVFFRGSGEQIETTAMDYSVVNYFARPLLFNLAFLIILMRAKRRSFPALSVWLAAGVMAVFVSPVGIPRSLAGALYIPLLVLGFVPRWYRKYSILTIITVSVLVAAPMVDVFRLIYLENEIHILQNFNFDYFFAGHFDAFHNLAQVVERGFASEGWQVIGALLFWVPRAMWPGKPVGTSFTFAEFAGYRSANVSFPLTAELFVDFGVLGILLGMLCLGLIYKCLDNLLSRPRDDSVSAQIVAFGHLEVSILGIYLLRGALMSTFAYTTGVAVSLILLWKANRVLTWIAVRPRRSRTVPDATIRSEGNGRGAAAVHSADGCGV